MCASRRRSIAAARSRPYYDPLLAKLIAKGDTREDARTRLLDALGRCRLAGVETNREFLRAGARGAGVRRRAPSARACSISSTVPSQAIEVLDGGTQTTVQDHPGRLGYWHVGVPPSGPMDALSFRLANRLVGNPATARRVWSAR